MDESRWLYDSLFSYGMASDVTGCGILDDLDAVPSEGGGDRGVFAPAKGGASGRHRNRYYPLSVYIKFQ